MSNEEFQKIVIEELRKLNEKVGNLEQGQKDISKDVQSIIEQTADLSEFRVEINTKVDKVINRLNAVEIVTSQNWNDIANLKSVK